MIKHKTLDFEYPANTVYIVEINSSETASGEILLKVPELTEILTSTTEIFLTTPPTVLSSKFVKLGSDLITEDNFNLDSLELSTGEIKLFWRFDALELSAEDGQFYSINILINNESSAEIAQANVIFIVKINNSLIVEA